jgi:hypothetical protein
MAKKGNNQLQIRNSTAEFLIFTKQANEDGIEVRALIRSEWKTAHFSEKIILNICLPKFAKSV